MYVPLSGSIDLWLLFRQANWNNRHNVKSLHDRLHACVCSYVYLSHDRDGRLSFGLCDSVLDQVIHVLVIQQSDQMKRAETGGTAQGQISDHHRTAKHTQTLWDITTKHTKTPNMVSAFLWACIRIGQ